MKRRGLVILAGAVVTALLGAGVLSFPLPYVVLGPGPTVDTLGSSNGRPVITVDGAKVSPSAGQLRLTTVRVETEVGPWEALASWIDSDLALVPRSVAYPPGLTDRQNDERNAAQFTASQRSAETVAARELGHPPYTVTFDLDEIGGPSAGLMFTLGLIDKLTPADLTGGRIIAGTGTVDDTGAVGPISGIPQKLTGAEAAGAQLFLVPERNCAEALANAVDGLPLVKVATVSEALAALRTYAAGGTPALCAPA